MSIRKRAGTNKWVHDYFDAAGKRHQVSYDTQREAKEAEARIRTELKGNIHVPDGESITVNEAGKLWLAAIEKKLERTTYNQYAGHLTHHIVPLIGNAKLNKIGVPFVYNFLDRLRAKGCSEAMVRNVRVSLGSLLRNAQKKGYVAINAVAQMGREMTNSEGRHKKRLKYGVDIPTTDEVKRIAAASSEGRPRVFIRLAALTGMRASELRGLTWDAVDLNKGEIEVSQRADAFGKLGSPKSKSSSRSIPLPPQVVAELRTWKLACPSRVFVFPALRKVERDGVMRDNVMNHSNIVKDWWHPAQLAAGVSIKTDKLDADGKPVYAAKYTGLHALRHYFASYCINSTGDGGLGLNPKVVQERLGHSSIVLTMDVYGHLFPRGDAGKELEAGAAGLY